MMSYAGALAARVSGARWWDAAVALALSAAGVWLAVADTPGGSPAWPAAVLALLVGGPLAWRREWPLAVFGVQLAAALAGPGLLSPRITFLAVVIGAYSLVVHGRWPVLSVAVLLATGVSIAITDTRVDVPVPGWAGALTILLPVALFGLLIRSARARAEAATGRAEAVRAAAIAQERARIARELHDVVSHHVSVMVIQAGAAQKVIGDRPELARGALAAIAASGREAMAELRHALGVLAPAGRAGERPDEEEALHPQPGLDQLDALVDRVRAAGQPVTVRSTAAKLPHGLDVAAYRLVQEALTNALRYAPGATTKVTVDVDDGLLRVEVTDEGVAGRPRDQPGTGSGLIGLSERIALYGGQLATGHRPGGGFRVSATVPLERAGCG